MKNTRLFKFILLFIGLFTMVTTGAWAQEAEAQVAASSAGKFPGEQTLLVIVLVIFVLILLVVLYTLYALNIFLGNARSSGVMKDVPAIFKFTDPVPIDREHEILLDHDYDGIRELDNRLPPWWVYMFYGTIVFSFFYIWFYHFSGTGKLQEEEYNHELAQAEVMMKLAASKVDENSVTLLTSADKLKSGEAIYISNCAPCHGKKGEGGVGPNLADEYWIHGGSIKDIFKTVKYGVPVKGMIPWQAQLGPGQIQEVSSYIKMMKGTNPPNPKAPQGELYQE